MGICRSKLPTVVLLASGTLVLLYGALVFPNGIGKYGQPIVVSKWYFRYNETQETKQNPKRTSEIFLERSSFMRNACGNTDAKFENNSICGNIVIHKPLNLSWCNVPKVVSTYWKKVFYLLSSKEKKIPLQDMSKIGFIKIHTQTRLENTCKTPPTNQLTFLTNQNSFIISRDPFSRLFSAYIDKLYLSDHWGSVGRHIVANFRKRSNYKEKNNVCGHDVTFQEFIEYVIDTNKGGKGLVYYHDNHWKPIFDLCHPCQIDYKFIAKHETFRRDRDFLTEQFGINKYLNKNISGMEDAQVTITQRIEAFWGPGLRCMSTAQLMERMWSAFQIQGYLPLNESLESNTPHSELVRGQSDLTSIVLKIYNKYRSVDLHSQKLESLMMAYGQLSFEQMKAIQDIFIHDFQLFDYDPEPLYLFDRFHNT